MPSFTRTTASSPAPEARPQVSPLEKEYGVFYDSTIAASDPSNTGAAALMRDLNRISTIVAGLGSVLRIVSGNCVLEDEFDPENPDSHPPLSKTSEGMLTAMAAAVCEMMYDKISATADRYNDEVGS